MTLGEMIDRVMDLVGEDPRRPKDFSRAEVGRYLNETYRRFVRETGALEAQFWVDIKAQTALYTLPPNMAEIFRVVSDSRRIPSLSTFELDRFHEEWENENGEIEAYTVSQREMGQIRTYRNPATSSRYALQNDLGVVVGGLDEVGDIELDVQMRYASLTASLGVVTDYEETSQTVVFAAAALGGGADSDFGTVVKIVDSAVTNRVNLATQVGVVVDLSDSEKINADDVIFTDDVQSTTDEFGAVLDAWSSDTSDVFLFGNQEGVNRPVIGTGELGEVIWWKSDEGSLEVWARETQPILGDESMTPETPAWTHLALVYGAVSRALVKLASTRDEPVSAAYGGFYQLYEDMTKKLVANSTQETQRGFGMAAGGRMIRGGPRLPGTYPRTF